MINRRLATRLTHLQIERILRVETVAELMAAQVGRTLQRTLAQRKPQKITDTLAELPERLVTIADSAFERLAVWSHRETVGVFVRTFPRKWFRAVNPAVVLVGEDAGDQANPFLVDDGTGPHIGERMGDEEWAAWVQEHVFPAPDAARVREIMERPTAGQPYEQRIRGLSKLIEPEVTALRMAEGFSEGKNIDELARDVLPHIDGGVRASAKRIARTEGLRVANTMQREMYADLGDLMVGTQILATLDEHTRPEHALRNGRIYYNDLRKQPNVDTLPVLPDEPNCRCFDVPVMKMPEELANDPKLAADFRDAAGAAIPEPTIYSEWFAGASESRRMLAVGKRRYNEAKTRLGRKPDWLDFVDKDGGLMKRDALAEEDADARTVRRREVQMLIDHRRQMIADIRASGFELPGMQGPPRPPVAPKPEPPEPPVAPRKKTSKKPVKKKATKKKAATKKKETRQDILQRIAARPLKDRKKRLRTGGKPQDEAKAQPDRGELVRKKMAENAENAAQIREAFLKAAPEDIVDREDFRQRREELAKIYKTYPRDTERLKELRASFRADAIAWTEQANRDRATLVEAIRPEHTVDFEFKGRKATIGNPGGRAQEFMGNVTSLEHAANPNNGRENGAFELKAKRAPKNRSFHRTGEGVFMGQYAQTPTWVHEAAHSLEDQREVHELCKGFLHHRVGDEAPVLMRHVVPSAGYKSDEQGRKDDFLKTYLATGLRDHEQAANSAYYAGKHYAGATEILSMGTELLYEDPAAFARADPEWFDFTVGILNGELL